MTKSNNMGMGPQDRLLALLADHMAQTNQLIRVHMQSENAPRIPEVTAHLIEAGGKRLRPLLVLAAAEIFGIRDQNPHRLAATVEFIHTATLLHDDVVDESAKRRGRPTANLLWDNKSSILVGDYLFARAFRLMVETGSLEALDILSAASATIAEGEVLQLTAAGNIDTDEAAYLQIIRGKTAALFAAATEVGGLIGGASREQVSALRRYGDAIGVAFQIADDVLDYGGASAALGKNTGDDFRERKLTLPVIRAIASSNADERHFWGRVLGRGEQHEGDLAEAMSIIERHGALQSACESALNYVDDARNALTLLPAHPVTDLLAELATEVVSRIR